MIVAQGGAFFAERTESVAAIGVFDGLHLGHQAVISQLIALARSLNVSSTVVTFDPSPAMFFAPTKAPRLLGTIEQRLEGLEALGVDRVLVLTFDAALANESAPDFIDRVLVGELRVRGVVVGEDFHFGHNRTGDVALLRTVGERENFTVEATAPFGEGARYSSTLVRKALGSGDLKAATSMLGRSFTLRGDVVHGDDRGTGLGFPTANLAVSALQQLPSEGVYAGATTIDGTRYAAAISVGTRPQFYDDGVLLVEVYLLGFAGDLYDTTMDVAFLARLRDQKTFDQVTELTDQIERDVAQTQEIFALSSLDQDRLLR